MVPSILASTVALAPLPPPPFQLIGVEALSAFLQLLPEFAECLHRIRGEIVLTMFMVITGEGKLAGGLLVSAGNALLFMAIFWGKAGKRFGGRRTMTFAYFAMSAALLAAGFVGETVPLLTGAFLLGGAFFAIALDALGSTAFMRSVRSYERPQMAAVYRTYLDFSELTPPLVYSVALAFFGLGSVFVTLGLLAAVCGFVTWRYLPKSL